MTLLRRRKSGRMTNGWTSLRFRPCLELLEHRLALATFTVTNTLDNGPGSLRQAIVSANTNPGLDTIAFAIGSGPRTIIPLSQLPTITNPVVIDGTTQPGYKGTPLIELNGTSAGSANGLVIMTSGSTVQGLVINRFAGNGVRILGVAATGNRVVGNFIGTDLTGTLDVGNSLSGVLIDSAASNNTVGGSAVGAGNVISGNNSQGVFITDAGTTGNQVLGNLIGTDVTGSLDLGNNFSGVFIRQAPNNLIGGTAAGARNVIAGNNNSGVAVVGNGATGNLVQGNFIGTDVTGSNSLANSFSGVFVGNGSGFSPPIPGAASNNTIGGIATGAGNLISGNDQNGIWIFGVGATGNQVEGNFIGTDVTGSQALGNSLWGVLIDGGAAGNTVGGTTPGARNVISGSGQDGIRIFGSGTASNRVEGNFIATDVTGTRALGNAFRGVLIDGGASGNTVGGTSPGAGNLISGNNLGGVLVFGTGTTNNRLEGNFIGTDSTGTRALGNGTIGVLIDGGAAGNMVGGTSPGAGNLISGNGADGIFINGSNSGGNRVEGNFIGTDLSGTQALGNGGRGVNIRFASNNMIGGTAHGARNVISGNSVSGIVIQDPSASGNQVLGNFIGTDVTGTAPLGNGIGITIGNGASNNTVGGTSSGAGNIIAFNSGIGLRVVLGEPTGNVIRGNSIHSNGFGIDLSGDLVEGDGVTPNDDGDGDSGPNNLQNYPVLSAAYAGTTTRVVGVLNSVPSTTFTVDFYASASADPSGFGQGERYLGSILVTTDKSGNASFDEPLASATAVGEVLTATATDPGGNTSEFSAVLALTVPATVQDLQINDGAAQRSRVTSITVTFSDVVTLDPGAFELLRQGGGLVGLEVTTSVVNGRTVAVLTFSGEDIIAGSLADGNYTLTIRGDLVHGTGGLDLDGNGVVGGDRVEDFFRLFGDTDGDRDVDDLDSAVFDSAFGSDQGNPHYLWYLDFDGDGDVDDTDLLAFQERYGTVLNC